MNWITDKSHKHTVHDTENRAQRQLPTVSHAVHNYQSLQHSTYTHERSPLYPSPTLITLAFRAAPSTESDAS